MRDAQSTSGHGGRRRGSSLLAILALLLTGGAACAEEQVEQIGLSTAVALNYCRASFHQIRKYPARNVLYQERDQILNNLNLNEIADEEVIRLYAAVLDEIGDVQIAEQERLVLKDKHQRIVRRQLIENAYILGTHVVAANYVAAVRAGASSWWDYRTAAWNRDLELWQVDKSRMVALIDKSTHFLDTFWKLARKRTIPDEWLIRNQDLDALEDALSERDLEVRLRVLKRMERFMQAYPPYWYYVGRTQQALGQLFAAAETYHKLETLAAGHFRKDEMLAAAAANRAVIQDYLRQREAADTAQAALRFSTNVWEVNLLCARVLARHERFAEAEDAALRNLDLGLEGDQSRDVLLSVYYHSRDVANISKQLRDPKTVRSVSIPLLLQCATLLPDGSMPRPLAERLNSSFLGYYDVRFGSDDLVLLASNDWQIPNAEVSIAIGKRSIDRYEHQSRRGHSELRLRRVAELGHPLALSSDGVPITVTLQYPQMPTTRLHLKPTAEGTSSIAGALELVKATQHRGSLRVSAVDVDFRRLALSTGSIEALARPYIESGVESEEADLPSLLGVIDESPQSGSAEDPLKADVDEEASLPELSRQIELAVPTPAE